MDNSFFIFKDKDNPVKIKRFHICSWEFQDETALIEFGCEIELKDFDGNELNLYAYIPWLNYCNGPKDLYPALRGSENSKFIFNELVDGTDSLDGGCNNSGVVHKFLGRPSLCILPISTEIFKENSILKLSVNLLPYKAYNKSNPNIYFRYSFSPPSDSITTRKIGISKSTIIYDLKVNEQRNMPRAVAEKMSTWDLCPIESCFCLNVLPNKYELTFLDKASLKNVRTLEFDAFSAYLQDDRLKKDELIVIFNKKKADIDDESPSYSFFSIFHKERIGVGQFALAVLVNLICGFLLFWPSYKSANNLSGFSVETLKKLPVELYLALFLVVALLLYFVAPVFPKLWYSFKAKVRRRK